MDRCPYYMDSARCSDTPAIPRCECFGDLTECERDEKIIYPLTPEVIFKNALRVALKDRVKDFVRIFLIDDYIRIDFYHCGDYSYCHIIHNIMDKLDDGLDADQEAAVIAECYKGVILNRYFKK